MCHSPISAAATPYTVYNISLLSEKGVCWRKKTAALEMGANRPDSKHCNLSDANK